MDRENRTLRIDKDVWQFVSLASKLRGESISDIFNGAIRRDPELRATAQGLKGRYLGFWEMAQKVLEPEPKEETT